MADKGGEGVCEVSQQMARTTPGTHKRNRAFSPLQRTKSLGPFSERVASRRQPEESGRGVASDSAFSDDVAFAARGQRGGPGLVLLVLGLGLQSFQSPFGSEKNYFLEFFLFFSVLLLGKEGGSKANKARQGRAGQGRQFVIMVRSAMAFWPGGNVIPEIIALAFSRAGSLPHVCVRVSVSLLRPSFSAMLM